MDENFLDNLKFMSKGVLEEQQNRPETAASMKPISSTSFGSGARPPSSMGGRSKDTEVTTLASYRPESAAFAFTFNRPGTGRVSMDSERTIGQARGMLASARTSRANLASARPKSSFRKIDEFNEYIPDLDEVREEDLTMTVASAPAYELQRMASLTELDAELSQTKALSIVDGVNLRKLCKFLVPEKELAEQDEYWSWDRLYTEIISSPELSHLVRFQKKGSDSDFDSLTFK